MSNGLDTVICDHKQQSYSTNTSPSAAMMNEEQKFSCSRTYNDTTCTSISLTWPQNQDQDSSQNQCHLHLNVIKNQKNKFQTVFVKISMPIQMSMPTITQNQTAKRDQRQFWSQHQKQIRNQTKSVFSSIWLVAFLRLGSRFRWNLNAHKRISAVLILNVIQKRVFLRFTNN